MYLFLGADLKGKDILVNWDPVKAAETRLILQSNKILIPFYTYLFHCALR